MTGKTHRVGGMLSCLGGYTLLKANGMLLGDVDPLLQLTVMYPFALYGSVFSDLDHHKESIPCRDIASVCVNRVLHLTSKVRSKMSGSSLMYKPLGLLDAKHRSWQTHSDLFLFLILVLSRSILLGKVTGADSAIIKLISIGFLLGVISHLILDMLTPEGVWSFILVSIKGVTRAKKFRTKISFVPNISFFRTGGSWESIIRCLMWVACILLIGVVFYEYLPYKISFL